MWYVRDTAWEGYSWVLYLSGQESSGGSLSADSDSAVRPITS